MIGTSLLSLFSAVSMLRPFFACGLPAAVGSDFDLSSCSYFSNFTWLGFDAPYLSRVKPLASSFYLLLSATSINNKIKLNIINKADESKFYSRIRVTKRNEYQLLASKICWVKRSPIPQNSCCSLRSCPRTMWLSSSSWWRRSSWIWLSKTTRRLPIVLVILVTWVHEINIDFRLIVRIILLPKMVFVYIACVCHKGLIPLCWLLNMYLLLLLWFVILETMALSVLELFISRFMLLNLHFLLLFWFLFVWNTALSAMRLFFFHFLVFYAFDILIHCT